MHDSLRHLVVIATNHVIQLTISGTTSHTKQTISHHGLLSVFTIFWGANFILAEIALGDMSAISFSVSRFVMGGFAMLTVFYIQTARGVFNHEGHNNDTSSSVSGNDYTFRVLPKVKKKDWPRLLVVSVIGATLAPWIGIEGLGLTHGSRASLWLALGPALSAGIGWVMKTEKISRVGILGIFLAAGGTVLLAYDGLIRPEDSSYLLGDLLLLTALILTITELHLIKPLANTYGSVNMVALRTVVGGALYIIIATPSLIQESWLTFDFWTWFAILAGGAIGVGVGQWVKVRALKSIGPTRVVIYGNLVPVATIVIAWLSVGQNPDSNEIIAGLLIVAGAFLIEVLDGKGRKLPD